MSDDLFLELFQSFTVEGDAETLKAFRSALLKAITAPWRSIAPEEIDRTFGIQELLVFERAGEAQETVRLSLYRTPGEYGLANIVPAERGQLTRSQYNQILQQFATGFAAPAAAAAAADFRMGAQFVTLEQSLGAGPAAALRRLSSAANQSNAAAHPSDQKRLYDVILSLKGTEVETGTLTRFLVLLSWPEEVAQTLAAQIDFGVGLLAREHGL